MTRAAPRTARRRARLTTFTGVVGLVAALGLAAATPRSVLAAPPTSEDFQVTYFLTDEYGDNTSQQLTLQHMQWYVNQARCECGHDIVARIRLQGSGIDSDQMRAHVGQMCAQAQAFPVGQFAPCAQLVAGLPQTFQQGPEYAFDPVWLAWGVSAEQAIETAMPVGGCEAAEGQGGIWMCSGVNACNGGDFFMSGDVNLNSQTADSPQGISFDFIPPVSPPTEVSVEPGDSAVEISWKVTAPGDIAGYRVLCSTADGAPVDNGVSFSAPDLSDYADGTVYFTAGNLCPGGAFGPDYDPNATGTGGTDTGGTDTGGTDTGTTTGGGCVPGEIGCICTADDTCVEGECNGMFCVDTAVDGHPIESLDWDYVCSAHIPAGVSSTKTRITGLDNDTEYAFLVVAYDRVGNPVAADQVVMATPAQTNGLWEQCEAQGNICGQGCGCEVGEDGTPWSALILFGLIGIGVGFGLKLRRRA